MITYKAIHLLENFPVSELNKFSSLFSERNNIIRIEGKPYICVPFNPDKYLINKKDISKYFQENFYAPLIVTNYKLLSLLLMISKNDVYRFRDFSFKEEGEEGEVEKDIIEGMILEDRNVRDTFDFLESHDQKIQFIELEIFESKNRIRIHSSGNISISNSFPENYHTSLIKIIEYLFTGQNRIS